ncbi:KilA-N domain-containing protein [Azonexus hydrophilus]|uniref:KilA-N domain-containing protein n=2 Tax=Azonexus hydrophilus TaxID=418702 RepID=A0ABZ2XDS8_9RHOO
MTKAAKHYGKRLDEFMSNKSTQEYIAAIQDVIPGITGITQGKRGFGGGTFCHPKLAVFFARWLDVRFAVWCDLMIDNILKGHIQTTVVVPTEEAL